MNRFSVKCPSCHFPLSAELYNSTEESHLCRSCDAKVKIHALPALYLPVGSVVETREAELGTSVCFFHETKQAENICDSCGRFLCELCSLPIGNELLCTSCLKRKKEDPEGSEFLIPRQTRLDKLALLLSLVPLMVFLFILVIVLFLTSYYLGPEIFYDPMSFAMLSSVFTAPAAMFLAFRYWRPRGIFIHGWRVRMTVSILLALIEIGVIVIGLIELISIYISMRTFGTGY